MSDIYTMYPTAKCEGCGGEIFTVIKVDARIGIVCVQCGKAGVFTQDSSLTLLPFTLHKQ